MFPREYRYSKEHEWVKVEGEHALIGITHHAQEQLGDIVYVELPKVGDHLEAGSQFGTVESVKAVAEVYLPVDGQVLDLNAELEARPELVNEDPHGAGWMIRIALANPGQLAGLMDHAAYEAFVAEESK